MDINTVFQTNQNLKENNNFKFTKMSRSRKGGKYARQKTALALLEATYERFKAAKEDKAPWTTTCNGKPFF